VVGGGGAAKELGEQDGAEVLTDASRQSLSRNSERRGSMSSLRKRRAVRAMG
jgi:hypothetical protein